METRISDDTHVSIRCLYCSFSVMIDHHADAEEYHIVETQSGRCEDFHEVDYAA